MSNIKTDLLTACKQQVQASIASATAVLVTINGSMQGETKSSAGDKFETSREMLQAEQHRTNATIIKAKKLEQKLNTLSIIPSDLIREGSLITTDSAVYFISVALGKIVINDKKYFVLSSQSPIGALLMNKQAGDSFSFNGNSHKILNVE